MVKMQTNSTSQKILDSLLYLVVFFLIQFAALYVVQAAALWHGGLPLSEIPARVLSGSYALAARPMMAVSILSSAATLTVFFYARWTPFSRVWLSSHPWAALAWVVCLALGSFLPSMWIGDQLQSTMPEATVRMFESMMGSPLGYLAIGILAPIAEEVVFRGAILRRLLSMFDKKHHWIPIILSAVIFGAVHLNIPQFVHATVIGLILGWMYYRTDSIIPGVVFHWINNSVVFLLYALMPQMANGTLSDLFHGDTHTVWLSLGYSACFIIPSLYQLYLRLRRG